MMVLTLAELSAKSGVSTSHLSRIELGERFPSARVLHKIAKPLGFNEGELFTYAGYLPVRASSTAEGFNGGRLDPYVARVLSQEPVETQRTVVAILSVLKSMAKGAGQKIQGRKLSSLRKADRGKRGNLSHSSK